MKKLFVTMLAMFLVAVTSGMVLANPTSPEAAGRKPKAQPAGGKGGKLPHNKNHAHHKIAVPPGH